MCLQLLYASKPSCQCRNHCCHCLKAVLISCVGFLSDSTRSLIDSAVSTGLSNLESLSNVAISSNGNVFDWSPVKVSLLDLASSCIITPWNDGGASNLRGILVQTARVFDLDKDSTVSMTAKAALRLCDTVSVPRAPALLFVSREAAVSSDNIQNSQMVSADDIIKNMKIAREETERANKIAEEAEKAKRQKLQDKRLMEGRMKEEKASKKRQKMMDTATEELNKTNGRAPEADKEKPQAASSKDSSDPPQTAIDLQKSSRKEGSDQLNKLQGQKEPDDNKMETEESFEMDKDDKPDDDKKKIESDETTSKGQLRSVGKEEISSDDDDDAFPDIVEGGPDSDDEE